MPNFFSFPLFFKKKKEKPMPLLKSSAQKDYGPLSEPELSSLKRPLKFYGLFSF